MNEVKTTVVIPNYNGKAYIEDCLSFLHRSKGTAFHTILVDNGSTDGSLELVKDRFPWVEVIAFSDNTGFCHAVNAGIRKAETEYVILLNNDTVTEPDFVKKLEESIERNTSIFSVSAKLVNMRKQTLVDDAGDFYCALGWAFARGKGKNVDYYKKRDRIFASCAGGAIYRRALLLELGLFDEEHFAYLEDIDIGYRARIYGYQNYFEPEAVVYHAGSASSGSRYNAFKVGYSARNSIYLIAKNMPFVQILINLPLLAFGFFIKTLFFLKKGMGLIYVKGLLRGLALSFSKTGRKNRVPFLRRNLKNYVILQLELWGNMVRKLLDF